MDSNENKLGDKLREIMSRGEFTRVRLSDLDTPKRDVETEANTILHRVFESQAQRVISFLDDRRYTNREQKLPFVYELQYDGRTSYAVGTKHNEPQVYTAHAQDLIGRVERVCLEISDEPSTHQPTIDTLSAIGHEVANFISTCTDDDLLRRVRRLAFRFSGRIGGDLGDRNTLPGVDGNIRNVALKLKRPVYGLETDEERFPHAIELITPLRIALSVLSALPHLADEPLDLFEQKLDRMDHAYRSGSHIQVLEDITALNSPHLHDRNQIMAYRAITHLVEAPTLIAVGVGHFVGPEPTMLDLWEEHGIEVRRLKK